MRIIAGIYKGRVLKGPKHEGLRPTADRVREALFNILSTKVQDAAFLDLFAGTGAIGVEALSRGAASVVFVDANNASIKLLQENIRFLDGNSEYQVLKMDAKQAIKLFSTKQTKFDLIFLDPPFAAGLLQPTVDAIQEAALLKPNGVLVAEHPRNMVLESAGLEMVLTRNYGDIGLTFFQNNL